MSRLPELQSVLDAAQASLRDRALKGGSPASIARIFDAARTEGAKGAAPHRLPVCKWFDIALEQKPVDPDLDQLFSCLRALAPYLVWRTRSGDDTASPGFAEMHANAMIVGPGGIEHRPDAWIGLSLMAPHTRYPDHRHAPEETYLVLSQGEFRQADGEWFEPGIGGSFYNPPDILHAMRSGDTPLLALWALWSPQDTQH